MRIPKDDLTYTVFSEIYLRMDDPKGKRKAFLILESALKLYAKKGWDQVSMQMIARDTDLSRTALLHYFKDPAELRIFAIKYVRLLFQRFAIDAMSIAKTPDKMLEAYVRSCFKWVDSSRLHAQVWLSFVTSCVNTKQNRALNTVAVEAGNDRIAALLSAGKAAGFFTCENPQLAATTIQALIAGGMLCYGTEDSKDEGKGLIEGLVAQAFFAAGAKPRA
ncbi:TetR/AcrR family transcriptional regulator [Bdellovibrio sp. HCB288]|uniref:TetR/AcrR family transcriptional regulator n=1 Tax=Bdellovibrio sp. HCB288 TaxID=3394355 RepID=UPI0039B39B31